MRDLSSLWKHRKSAAAIVVIGEHAGVAALASTPRVPTPVDPDLAWLWRRQPAKIVYADDLAEAAAAISQTRCDRIVIPPEIAGRANDLRDALGRRPRLTSVGWLLEELFGRVPLANVTNDEWLAQCGSARPLGRGHRWMKRALDLLFVAAVAPALPIGALILLAIGVGGDGLAIERRTCVGLGGSRFVARRFTLRSEGASAVGAAGDSQETHQGAPSRLGLLLRQTGLDRSPVLWNVLLGQMTLVGPRLTYCEASAPDAMMLPNYAKRYAVRPGLVGWAQLRMRSRNVAPSPRHELEHDLYYVKHASMRLDLQVLATAAMSFGRGVGAAAMRGLRASVMAAAETIGASLPKPATQGMFSVWRRRRAVRPGLETTLIVGAGEGGKLLARELGRNAVWGYRPIAFVDDDPKKLGTRIQGLPVLGDTQAIPAIVQREAVDVVIIAIPSGTDIAMARIRDLARQSSARVLTMPHIGQLLRGEASSPKPYNFDLVDVLGRPAIGHDVARCRGFIAGRRVLITGAAGSIGQEVTRQVAQLGAAQVIALDINETGLFDLQQEVAVKSSGTNFQPVVASVTNPSRLAAVFARYRPEIVFHVAAYKHVPLMEEHPAEAVITNVVGTYETAQAAARFGVERFVSVSTDKAVRPSSVMGASKRVAELAIQAVARETGLSACSVRFGNVLGSRGSVMLTFQRQIDAGGPMTITHPAMKRFFMTIPEAASLIIEAGVLGDRDAIYLLDMGEEVSIVDVAQRMIRMRGLRVGKDIEIVFTGLRPGEKLQEELRHGHETVRATLHPKITCIVEPALAGLHAIAIDAEIQNIVEAATAGDEAATRQALFALVGVAGGMFETLDVPDLVLQAG